MLDIAQWYSIFNGHILMLVHFCCGRNENQCMNLYALGTISPSSIKKWIEVMTNEHWFIKEGLLLACTMKSNLDLLWGDSALWKADCPGSSIPEEGEWKKGIYPQTLIIPNLEHWHKEERMCKERMDTKASGGSKGELRVTSSTEPLSVCFMKYHSQQREGDQGFLELKSLCAFLHHLAPAIFHHFFFVSMSMKSSLQVDIICVSVCSGEISTFNFKKSMGRTGWASCTFVYVVEGLVLWGGRGFRATGIMTMTAAQETRPPPSF